MKRYCFRPALFLLTGVVVAVAAFSVNHLYPGFHRLQGGLSWMQLLGVIAAVVATAALFTLVSHLVLALRGKPPVEGMMIGRLYWLLALLSVAIAVAYGMGFLAAFATAFSLFGGMLLGWSLQAPVSGFAAWILVSLKRPFRPGDRVQFPTLNLTGDIKDVGPMYTVLDQVGGSIGSEEAVGRDILVPNAMLFGQVVINYTASQKAAYMLDEVVVRITYDSNWRAAEAILVKAANTVTRDVVEATGAKPYVRADLYDYGVYLRLSYQTRVKDRVETSYEISKLIFEEIQATPSVDVAIPFVYSYRAGQDRKTDEALRDRDAGNLIEVDVAQVTNPKLSVDPEDLDQLARSIDRDGLLQPIVMAKNGEDGYEILAGHLRFEACKRLGWKKVPAILRHSNNAPEPARVAGLTAVAAESREG